MADEILELAGRALGQLSKRKSPPLVRRVAPALPRQPRELAPYIDHTLLEPRATSADVDRLCDEALRHGFAGVCVNGAWVEQVALRLRGSEVLPVAVVGFPLGAGTSLTKAFEAADALARGAREIDMVMAIGALKSGEKDAVRRDIEAVVAASAPFPVKVILETALLSEAEKRLACSLAKEAGAAFVKTSTGFGGGGATAEDVALLRACVGDSLYVKASGGVRTAAAALAMIRAGADRIGASASVAIVEGSFG